MLKFIARYWIGMGSVILLFTYLLSVKLQFYYLAYPYLGYLDAYLIDNFKFLLLFFLITGALIFTKKISIGRKDLLVSLILFLFFLGYLLIFQTEILDRYFVKDDFHQVLVPLNTPERIHISLGMRSSFFYYQFPFFSLAYRFFHYNTFAYNLIALIGMALAGVSWFFLLNYLKKKYINSKDTFINTTIIILLICTYLVSTAIMDIYTYMENSVAMGLILLFSLLAIQFYIIFLEEKKGIFFLLSLILILFLVKSSNVRTAFIPPILVFLECLYLVKNQALTNKKELFNAVLRSFSLILVFGVKNEAYFNPNIEGRIYGHTPGNFLNIDKVYLVFSNIIPSFIPYTIWTYLYKVFTYYVDVSILPSSHIFNNLLFTLGGALFIIIFSLALVLSKRKINVTYIVFFSVATLVSMAFFMFFGNSGKSAFGNSFDKPFVLFADTPGSRYYLYSTLFIFTSFYLIVGMSTKTAAGYIKKIIYSLTVFILFVFMFLDIRLGKHINQGMTTLTMIPLRVVTEKAIAMVPGDKEQKIIYSTGGNIKVLQFWGWDGFAAMYKNTPPNYIVEESVLIKEIADKKIKKENFYAFYFNPETLEFRDKTQQYREKYSQLFNQTSP